MAPSSPLIKVFQRHVLIGDPHITSDNSDRLSILNAIVEPLIQRAAGGLYRPCLAKHWELSSDARLWTFYLRDDVTFHDGSTLCADDVVATLERIRDEDVGGELGTQGVYQSYLKGSDIAVTHHNHVTICTPEPMADLLDLLVDIPILPKHSLENLPDSIIGSGPYQLEVWHADRVVITPYPKYRNNTPQSRGIEWYAIPDDNERLHCLLEGKADVITNLPATKKTALHNKNNLRLITVQTSVCATFMCNLITGPCTNVEVRQALNYALNIPQIINTLCKDAAVPLTGPLTSLHLGFDPETRGYTYDPDRARTLLEQASINKTLTLDVPTSLPDEAPELARLMIDSYQQVGLNVTMVEYTDRPAYANKVRAKDIHDAACFDSSPLSTFRILREKFHSEHKGPWWLGYDNPEVNQLIDTARATPDVVQRRSIFQRAYRLISHDAPWIFLYNPIRYVGATNAIHNLQITPEGLIRFL